MLSLFIKKLLFTRQFFLLDGKFEILGISIVGLPITLLHAIQLQFGDSLFPIIKDEVRNQISSYISKIGLKREGIVEDIPELFHLYGLGKIEVEHLSFDDSHAIVKVYDSPLPKLYQDKKNPPCVITCAVLSGSFSAVFSRDVTASINKCYAKGSQFCEFVIK